MLHQIGLAYPTEYRKLAIPINILGFAGYASGVCKRIVELRAAGRGASGLTWDSPLNHSSTAKVAARGNADLQFGSGRPRQPQLQYTFARAEACLRLPAVEV
jgi:hypothetical protein